MRTGVQLVVGRRARIKEDRGAVCLQWMYEAMILGRSDVHGDASEWVVLDFNPVGSKLIRVYEGVVEQLPHPYCFVENQDVGHSVDRAGNSCCTSHSRLV